MDIRKLRTLIAFLRKNGVIQYTDGPVSLVLGDKPTPLGRARVDKDAPPADEGEDPRWFLERIHEANLKAGRAD